MKPVTAGLSFDVFNRQAGVIVTWRDSGGTDRSTVEPGPTLAALTRVADRIPAGGQVRSISNPKSILRDLTRMPARYGGEHRHRATVDPYSIERNLLGKIGRLDLLPEEAYPQGREASEKNKRRRSA